MAVIIGMDPHERSATIEVVDERAQVLAVGRFGTDKAGYAEMLAAGREYGRKSDPVDAHSVAMVGLRSANLVRVQVDPELVVIGMLVDRRDELGRARTQTINRLHRVLLELVPGGAKQFLSSHQARALIAAT